MTANDAPEFPVEPSEFGAERTAGFRLLNQALKGRLHRFGRVSAFRVSVPGTGPAEDGPGGGITCRVNEWPVSAAEQGVVNVGYVREVCPITGTDWCRMESPAQPLSAASFRVRILQQNV